MGLLDSMLGGNAPQGRAHGGLSPVVKAVLLALAVKAAHDYMNRNKAGAAPASQAPVQPGAGGLGGILGGLLGGGGSGAGGLGGLGGMLGGGGGLGGLGGLIGSLGGAGGLGALVEQFNRKGHGDALSSWVGTQPNQPIEPQQLAEVIGPEDLADLEHQSGLPRDQLLSALAAQLPEAIDHLTPQGRLPTDSELPA